MIPEDEERFLRRLIDTGLAPDLSPAPGERAGDGERFGRYELRARIGRGSAGAVYQAWDPQLRRVVALKVLEAIPTPSNVERFAREARAMAQLRHPYVVSVYELLDDGDRHAIAMELVEGGTFARALSARTMPLAGRVRVLQQVAEGVAFAHAHGIVHRDLKPENILLDTQGQPRVTDFGIARLAETPAGWPGQPASGPGPEERLTASGAWLGTPAYMSPEQAGEAWADIGPPSDVYSLGVILYEVLTGRLPFPGASAVAILQRIMTEDPVPPRALDRSVPRDLEAVCLKAMERDRSRRYSDGAALAADLDRYLRGEPVLAASPSPLRRFGRFARRHRRWTLAGAAVLLVALVAGAFLLREARVEREQTERQARVLRAEAIGGDITRWDAASYAPPDAARVPALLETMRRYEASLRDLLSQDPTLVDARCHLARAQWRLGRGAEALRTLDEALALEPANAACLLERGRMRLSLWVRDAVWTWAPLLVLSASESEEAGAEMGKALPEDALADLRAAKAAGLGGMYAEYAQVVVDLVQTDQLAGSVSQQAGPVSQQAGSASQQAGSASQQAGSASDPQAYPSLGAFLDRWKGDAELFALQADLSFTVGALLLARHGKAVPAAAVLTRSIDLRRSFPEAYALRALCRAAQGARGDDRGAMEDAEQAIRLDPYGVDGLLARGIARTLPQAMGPRVFQDATRDARRKAIDAMVVAIRDDFDEALRRDQTCAAALFCRSVAYLTWSRLQSLLPKEEGIDPPALARRALSDLDAALALHPRSSWVVELERAVIYEQVGDLPRARAAQEEALRLAQAAHAGDRVLARIKMHPP